MVDFFKQLKKEARPMRGQGSLAIILLAFLALGGGIFLFTNLSPSSSQTGQQPVTNPVDYVEETVLTSPLPEAKETTQKILDAAGIPISGAGTVTAQPGYEIRYIGPTEHVSWAEFSVAITANTADGVVAAKAAAEQWFLDQGYKPEDLCVGTPVVFFLSQEASKAVYDAGQTFNRVPSFCR